MFKSPDAARRGMRLLLPVLALLLLMPLAAADGGVVYENASRGDAVQRLNTSLEDVLVIGALTAGNESDAYVLPGLAGETLDVGLLVPEGSGFSPTVYLVWQSGQGLEQKGFRASPGAETRRAVVDDKPYEQLFNFSAVLPATGTYGIVVESPENATGAYALLLRGTLESAAPAPTPAPASPNPLLQAGMVIAAVLIVIGAAVVAYAVVKRKARKRASHRN